VDEAGVDLPVEREPLGGCADLGTETAAVLVDPLDVVAGHPPEIQ
jgi:hypothetical protein